MKVNTYRVHTYPCIYKKQSKWVEIKRDTSSSFSMPYSPGNERAQAYHHRIKIVGLLVASLLVATIVADFAQVSHPWGSSTGIVSARIDELGEADEASPPLNIIHIVVRIGHIPVILIFVS